MTAGVEISGVLQQQAWASRTSPPVEDLGDGVWSIPVPMPGSMRYTNVYVFTSSDGLTLIDAGWDDEHAWSMLCSGLVRTGHDITDVRRVLVTHGHRDHLGQAAQIRRESGAVVAMHPLEAAALPRYREALDSHRRRRLDWLLRCGVPHAAATAMLPAAEPSADLAEPDFLLEDGDDARAPGWHLLAMWTPGHTAGHLSFLEPDHGVLLTGDTLLPRVLTHAAPDTPDHPNSMRDVLHSLGRLRTCPAHEVLPAHEYRFRGLAARTGQLLEHYARRQEELVRTLADGRMTAWELATRLCSDALPLPAAPPMTQRIAVGDTRALLGLLAGRDEVEFVTSDGIDLWSLRDHAS